MADPHPKETKFIERLLARDERAFNELVELYGERVYRLLYRMLARREEAEDMAQEVFVQVFKSMEQFRGDAKLGTWIYRIAINLTKNRVRYLARRRGTGEDELEALAERASLEQGKGVTTGDLPRPDHLVEGYQVEAILKRCISLLEPEFREVLVLRDVEDLTYDEIVEILGVPEGTVKSRLHRGRAMLKEKVESALGEKIR